MAKRTQLPVPRCLVRNLTSDVAEILLYGVVGDEFGGVTAQQFARDMASLGRVSEIRLRINSPGGGVWDGMDIYNTLRRCDAKIVVDITGLCASIATLIAMAGDEIRIASNATWMVHGVQGGVWGTISDLEDYLKLLRDGDESIKRIYGARTGLSRSRLDELLSRDTFLTADEAKAFGFVDEVVNADPQAATPTNQAQPVPRLQTLDEAFLNRARDTIESLAALAAAPEPGEPPMTATPPTNVVPPAPATPAQNQTPPAAVTPPAAPAQNTPPPAPVPAAPPAAAPAPSARQIPATEAAEIVSACNLAGCPDQAAPYLLAGTPIADVRAQLLQRVCQNRTLPPAPTGGSPEPTPKPAETPADKFGKEFDDNAKTLRNLGIDRDQYIRSRCHDEGVEPPAKAAK